MWEDNPIRSTFFPFSCGLPPCREQLFSSAAHPERAVLPWFYPSQDGRFWSPLSNYATLHITSQIPHQHLASLCGAASRPCAFIGFLLHVIMGHSPALPGGKCWRMGTPAVCLVSRDACSLTPKLHTSQRTINLKGGCCAPGLWELVKLVAILRELF